MEQLRRVVNGDFSDKAFESQKQKAYREAFRDLETIGKRAQQMVEVMSSGHMWQQYIDKINAIEKLTQTTLRNIIGELELDETLTSRDTINKKLSAVLDDATDKWGVKVNRVELQDITPPDSVLTAMEKQMQAERNKRAQILTSEGQKAAEILASEGEKTAIINKAQAARDQAILEAEGEAQARIRKAEAEAKAIELITEAVGKSTNPANYLLAQKYIQMMQELAEGDKTKTVYLPYEATNLLGSIGGIKDLFKAE